MSSSSRIFDRETLLDLSVNMIPMGILLFFIVLFVLADPFTASINPVATVLQLSIVVSMFFALGILTWASGRAISASEKTGTDEAVYKGLGEAGEEDADVGTEAQVQEAEADEEPEANETDVNETEADETNPNETDANTAETDETAADETGVDETEASDSRDDH